MQIKLEKAKANGVYILRNVRLANPSLQCTSEWYGSTEGTARYGTSILIPKDNGGTEAKDGLIKLCNAKGQDMFGRAVFNYWVHDGDNQTYMQNQPHPNPKPFRFNHWYIKVVSKNAPNLKDLTGTNDYYHGALADVWFTINAYAGQQNSRNVTFSLVGVQKKDGGEQIPTEPQYNIADEFDNFSASDDFDDVSLI